MYIIDTGFGYISNQCATLVYGKPTPGNHGEKQLTVIQSLNPTLQIQLCELGPTPTNSDIINLLSFVDKNAKHGSILCIAFSIHYNKEIDDLITTMANKFTILVAGGNSQQDIMDLTPCSNSSVITVGSLNKSNLPASHNSMGKIDMWAPGTNIKVRGVNMGGSSIATAIAAGYYVKYKTTQDTQNAINDNFDNIITRDFI